MNSNFGRVLHFLAAMCLQTLCDKFHRVCERESCLYYVRLGKVEEGDLVRHLCFVWLELNWSNDLEVQITVSLIDPQGCLNPIN